MKNAAKTNTADPPPDVLTTLAGAHLDRNAGPLYRQIADILREPIESGRFPPGLTLPREADLSEFFGVSLITVRQALRDLADEGLVRKQSAKPAVVTAPPPKATTSFNFKSLEAIIASTAGRRIEILNYRKRRSARAQQVFGLGSNEFVWCLEAVLHSGTQPVSQNVFYFPPAIGARLKRDDFDDVVIFRAVQRHLGIKLRGAHVTVSAEVADATLAEQLSYQEGAPVMAMEMIYYSTSGEPVELTINRNRADAFSLEFDAPNEQK
ncbi:MAG: GntR family transcriptional regulator [Silicimonas sp.]